LTIEKAVLQVWLATKKKPAGDAPAGFQRHGPVKARTHWLENQAEGSSTESMTWITPLVHAMSVACSFRCRNAALG
jgi:hypothetical protein